MATPSSWKSEITDAEVHVVPLADQKRRGIAGWCTVGIDLEELPEVEVMCGGTNTKKPSHAALWRQGNLLHFGFQESPSELNDTGRALLENAIVYGARFTEDRPIAVTPSGFIDRRYPRSRAALRSALASAATTREELARHFGGELRAELAAKDAGDAKEWIRAHMGFLAADETGRLTVDPDSLALGIAIDSAGFFDAASNAASAGDDRAIALLARRIPEGPGANATPASWRQFVDAERDYLFFTESGGYVWLLDPLARKRSVPSAELRGSARASR